MDTTRDIWGAPDAKEQQVQRYEATRYAGVSLGRVQAVGDALGRQIREQVILPARRGNGDDTAR